MRKIIEFCQRNCFRRIKSFRSVAELTLLQLLPHYNVVEDLNLLYQYVCIPGKHFFQCPRVVVNSFTMGG